MSRGIGGFNTDLQRVERRYEWINDMIVQRNALVKAYVELLQVSEGRKNGEGVSDLEVAEGISVFCEHLIDYMSHGHFDLYPKLLTLIENASGRSLSIARRVMPELDRNMERLTDFNERYAEDLHSDRLDTLSEELVSVGELLEQRFRLEDRLIIGLRLVHTIVGAATAG